MANVHPADIYLAQLTHYSIGAGLFNPKPDLHGRVEIGDVGIIEKGRFVKLFSAVCGEEDVFQTDSVPQPHTFMELDLDDPEKIFKDERELAPGTLQSHSLTVHEIQASASG
jgi:hypothetical protein